MFFLLTIMFFPLKYSLKMKNHETAKETCIWLFLREVSEKNKIYNKIFEDKEKK